MLDDKSIFTFFEAYARSNRYNQIKEKVVIFFNNFFDNFKDILQRVANYLLATGMIFFMYILQIIIILKIAFNFWINGKNTKYKTSKLAKLVILINKRIYYEYQLFKQFVIDNKLKLKRIVLIVTGILPIIIFELVVFMIVYFKYLFRFQTLNLIIEAFKAAGIGIIDFILNTHWFIQLIVYITIYTLIAIYFAKRKGERNWKHFKYFVSDAATINGISGEPGAGKTLTLVQASLATEENMIDMYEEDLIQYEIANPNTNFALVRLMFRIMMLDFNEEEIPNIIKSCPNILFKIIELRQFKECDVFREFYNNYYRGTSIVSFTPVLDPYYDTYSRIGDVGSMRFFKKLTSVPYEPDMTICYPEFDKEFNSHDSKSEVGEDGTYAFFAFVSHLLDRSGGVWYDTQDKDQVIKRVRGIAGKYYHIEKKKIKIPFLLRMIYYPLLMIYNRIIRSICSYLGTRPKTEEKWTYRKKQTVYKRNNLSLIYLYLKYFANVFQNIISYIERYQYFKIYAQVSTHEDMSESVIIKYNLNVMDFYHKEDKIYDSTYFKNFYNELKAAVAEENGLKQNLSLLKTWSSIDPTFEEYASTGQRLLAKVVLAQYDDETAASAEDNTINEDEEEQEIKAL